MTAHPCPPAPEPVEAVLAAAEPWLEQCGVHDAGLPMACTCPPGDFRPVMLALFAALRDAGLTSEAGSDPNVHPCARCGTILVYGPPDDVTLCNPCCVEVCAENAPPSAPTSAVEALADQWNETPDYAPSDYDQGRVDQRHDMTGQLLEALAADKAKGR